MVTYWIWLSLDTNGVWSKSIQIPEGRIKSGQNWSFKSVAHKRQVENRTSQKLGSGQYQARIEIDRIQSSKASI